MMLGLLASKDPPASASPPGGTVISWTSGGTGQDFCQDNVSLACNVPVLHILRNSNQSTSHIESFFLTLFILFF